MALANIVLADGQATPVNHTFSEVQTVPFALWAERLGITIGEPQFSAQQSRPSKSRRSQKTTFTLTKPTLETITGDVGGYAPTPRVAYVNTGKIEFVASDRSTLDERKDLWALMASVMANTMLQGMVEDQTAAS